ncbi:hypothetical protein Tco_1378454 [Tanacetum coccineum]
MIGRCIARKLRSQSKKEKFEGGFEQDIDNEGERDIEDEDGDGETRKYFLQYTQLDIPEFRETLVQFMEYVKKSIDERALHKREHDRRVNERQTQTTMEKVDMSKELDVSSVIIKSNGTESQEQDTSSRSGNDAHVDDADIRPIYDEEPKAESTIDADYTCIS